jgi:hypothetical protein
MQSQTAQLEDKQRPLDSEKVQPALCLTAQICYKSAFESISIPLQHRFFAWGYFHKSHPGARNRSTTQITAIEGLPCRGANGLHYPPLRWSLGLLGWRENVLVDPIVALALRSSIFLRSISS